MIMKPCFSPLVFACLLTLLHVFTAAACAADDAPAPPDYKAVVNAAFDKAVSCRITGHYGGIYAGGTTLEIDYITPDAQSLQKLKDLFLREKPRYLGSEISARLGEGYIHSFYFTWLDKHGKKTAEAALLSGDMLTFNEKMLFTTSPPEYNSVTLQECVAYLILKKNVPTTPDTPAQPPASPDTPKVK